MDELSAALRQARDRVQALLEAHPWRFAKTMPENPHWYTLRWEWADDGQFVDVVRFIRSAGEDEVFRGRVYRVLRVGGFKYWTMGARIEPGPYDRRYDTILINRKPEGADAAPPAVP